MGDRVDDGARINDLGKGEGYQGRLSREEREGEIELGIRLRIDVEITEEDGEVEERGIDVETDAVLAVFSSPTTAVGADPDARFSAVSYYGADAAVRPFLATVLLWGIQTGELAPAVIEASSYNPGVAGHLASALEAMGVAEPAGPLKEAIEGSRSALEDALTAALEGLNEA